MGATAQYEIGDRVSCEDGECGRLERVVIDPVQRKLTHLVVAPGPREGEAKRLVPVTLVDEQGDQDDQPGAGEGIALHCTRERFAQLEPAEEAEFLPGGDNTFGYGPGQIMVWPFFGPNAGILGMGAPAAVPGAFGEQGAEVHERVPVGEVQVRRGEHVEASDGEVGRVHGLVVDEHGHDVTHVLLALGHLWGKKTVAVPIADVTRVGEAIRVRLSKEQLQKLPGMPADAA